MLIQDSGKPAGDGKGRRPGWGTEPEGRSKSTGAGWGNGSSSTFSPQPPDRLPLALGDIKVLVACGYAAGCSTISVSLRKMGCGITEAENLQDALERSERERPHVAIVDVGLVAEHLENIGQLKRASPATKIIVLDGGYPRGLPDRAAALKEFGADIVLDETQYDTVHDVVQEVIGDLTTGIFARKEPEAERQTTARTVLIMCEDRDLVAANAAYLRKLGYDTLSVLTYNGAVAQAAEADLVIMDQGENWECLDVIKVMREMNPAIKIVIRPELLTDSKDERFAAADGVLNPIIKMGEMEAMLAEHLPLPAGQKKKEETITAKAAVKETPVKAKTHAAILVVDDEYPIQEMFRGLLETQGHTITTASNGVRGLEAYKKAFEAGNPFDVVVSDREMPDMPGAEMVAKIKEINPDAKIIYVTGHHGGEELKPLKETNPVAILGKPVRFEELLAAVNKALSG